MAIEVIVAVVVAAIVVVRLGIIHIIVTGGKVAAAATLVVALAVVMIAILVAPAIDVAVLGLRILCSRPLVPNGAPKKEKSRRAADLRSVKPRCRRTSVASELPSSRVTSGAAPQFTGE